MRSRRKHKRMGSMSIICITAIVGLSAMGVGYGYWTDSLNIGVGITTGWMNPEFDVDGLEPVEGLEFTIVDNRLCITGTVSPEFAGNIPVKIKNSSSIPVKLVDTIIDVNEIIVYNIPLEIQVETIELSDEDIIMIQTLLNNQQEELNIKELIEKLDIEKQDQPEYKIDKTLIFKQGL